MASTQLKRTNGTPTNAQKGTVSFWVKRSNLGSSQQRLMMNMVDGSKYSYIAFNGSHFIQHYANDSTQYCHFKSNALYRDTSAWYHFVFSIDTTQSDADNRVRIYVNGEEITSWLENARPTQNTDHPLLVASASNYHTIGASEANTLHFDGSMAHFHFIDGTQYPASTFGETDSTTGIWKPKTSPSVTYGNNGYFLDFASSSDMGNDVSGKNNDFTVSNGTLTQTIDTPSNVFATLNPLIPNTGNLTFSNGNLKIAGANSGSWTATYGVSTLGMSKGKYYCEIKIDAIGTNQVYPLGLINDIEATSITTSVGAQANGIGYYSDGRIIKGNTDQQTSLATITTGDIIGLAFDATNGTAQWYKNGATLGTQETGLSTTGTWYFVTNWYQNTTISANFGNGYFGTTAVSSAGTNSGIGTFEYDVPSGYKALCTKNINAQEYS